ncbi:MAG: gamma-glutamyltransferase [Gammaproteobacteria bacterium]|nr:gamma-glutamyltransferase [Gammaproteobacteria bacterium]
MPKLFSSKNLQANRMGKALWSLLYLFAFLIHTPIIANATEGLVVSEHQLASAAGAAMLKKGGNAIDAAVAVGYALAVVAPASGNIGGGGFMTIHLAGNKNVFINFREQAPLAAHADMFVDPKGKVRPALATQGYLAVAVPGTVLGLDTALTLYGTLPRSVVMQPAIRLATEGFAVTPDLAQQFKNDVTFFRGQPNIAAIFLNKGQPYLAGECLRQTNLGRTLTLIAKQGPLVFYQGEIAQAVVAASKTHGGLLTLADFARYTIQLKSPLTCQYRGYTLITAPLPSSGGIVLCEMLQILANFPLQQLGFHSYKTLQYTIEAMRYGFHDRNKLGDPDFVASPFEQFISKQYGATVAFDIEQQINRPALSLPFASEHPETTHYSVVDTKGNAASVTYTLNGRYGAGVIAGNTGFFLNDEMDDFSAGRNIANQFGLLQSNLNRIQPGKRPLSSMTPTIVLKNNKLFLVIGSPGGPRIITSVLLALLHVLNDGLTIDQAVNAPRFHFQGYPSQVFLEPFAFTTFIQKQLEWRGYQFITEAPWGAVEAIYVDPKTHQVFPGVDRRRPDGGSARVTLP